MDINVRRSICNICRRWTWSSFGKHRLAQFTQLGLPRQFYSNQASSMLLKQHGEGIEVYDSVTDSKDEVVISAAIIFLNIRV